MYDRAVQHSIHACGIFTELGSAGDFSQELAQLAQLQLTIRGDRCVLTATRFMESQNAIASHKSTPTWIPTKSIVDQPAVYSQDVLQLKQCKLVDFPPEFQTISCKPLFFDVANNHVVFPALDSRMAKSAMEKMRGFAASFFGKS